MSGVAVLLCRNNLKYSQSCLRTLVRQTTQPTILIIDNASDDGTVQWLRTVSRLNNDHVLMTVTMPEVRSVAACWNMALDWAFQEGYKEALCVNNDTELLPDTYALLKHELVDGMGMVTCVSVRTREELKRPKCFTRSPHPDYSCYMIADWAYERVRFDEQFGGAFYEDNDHHVRLRRAGIEAVSINLPFLHHGSMTLKNADDRERRRIEVNADRNREYFYKKYGAYPGTAGYDRLFE